MVALLVARDPEHVPVREPPEPVGGELHLETLGREGHPPVAGVRHAEARAGGTEPGAGEGHDERQGYPPAGSMSSSAAGGSSRSSSGKRYVTRARSRSVARACSRSSTSVE